MSHYEILKAMKTGFSDDFKTAIYANSISAKSYEQTVSGIPPLTLLNSSGKPLVSWSITGNTVQESEPSPDAPVEVKGVGEKAINLFDVATIKNATPVEFNGRHCLRGSDGPASPTLSGVFKENMVYSLTMKTYRNEGVTRSIKVSFYYTDGTRTTAEMYKPNDFRTTITSEKGKTVKDIHFEYLYNVVFYIDLEETALNEGMPIPLEKFGSYRIPAVSRNGEQEITTPIYLNSPLIQGESLSSDYNRSTENIFDINTCTNYLVNSNGVLTENRYYKLSEFIPVNKGIFITATNLLTDTFRVIRYDKNKEFISRDVYIDVNNLEVNNCAYIRINVNTDHWDISSIVVNGLTNRKIEWGKLVLTGDESWIYSSTSGIFYITGLQIDYKKTSYPAVNYYSTHFKSSASSTGGAGMKDGEIRFYNGTSSTKEIYIKYTAVGNVDAFKAWLRQQNANGTPVIVNYQLANPLTESFDVPEIPTFKGNCTISVDTEVQPSEMAVEYKSRR